MQFRFINLCIRAQDSLWLYFSLNLILNFGTITFFFFFFRQKIAAPDIKALISIFERSQDMAFIEDVLHMINRALSQNALLNSFLEQVNSLGGCHLFVNLLQRSVAFLPS